MNELKELTEEKWPSALADLDDQEFIKSEDYEIDGRAFAPAMNFEDIDTKELGYVSLRGPHRVLGIRRTKRVVHEAIHHSEWANESLPEPGPAVVTQWEFGLLGAYGAFMFTVYEKCTVKGGRFVRTPVCSLKRLAGPFGPASHSYQPATKSNDLSRVETGGVVNLSEHKIVNIEIEHSDVGWKATSELFRINPILEINTHIMGGVGWTQHTPIVYLLMGVDPARFALTMGYPQQMLRPFWLRPDQNTLAIYANVVITQDGDVGALARIQKTFEVADIDVKIVQIYRGGQY